MKKQRVLSLMLAGALLLSGCAAKEEKREDHGAKPALPQKLEINGDGVPVLRVYQVDEEESREMDVESYLRGVLAGEMKNDWPMEALKAQAILARTFVLKFCTEKESKYQGADISTDIEEAQAYDATGINDRIEQAVRETGGQVLAYRGDFPYAWFHAHSGGQTALAKEGLSYEKQEPGYIHSVAGRDSDQAPGDVKQWQASFSDEEVVKGAKKAGWQGEGPLRTIALGEKGESGRALTLLINGEKVSAAELRLALGGAKMKSTLLDSVKEADGAVTITGRGYGHGVGMPQWGAFALAQEGKTAQEIVTYYFQNVTVEKLW